jgi:alpha-1,2-mannosyltransferase
LGHGARVSYRIVTNPGLQGDLRIYRAAAAAYAEGRNPYEAGALTGASGRTQALPFVYPPVALPLLGPLLLFDYRTTYFLFFALKMAAVAALIFLWRRWLFRDDWSGACLYLLCALAYGQTIKMDLRAGNISVFEQLLIWAAALAFVRRRSWPFAALVAAAALFKLAAAGLLLLLLVDRERRNAAALLASMGGLALVHGVSAALRPDLFEAFLRNAGALDDRGSVNPASLALIRDGLERLPRSPVHADGVIYGVWVLLVLSATLWAFRRHDFRSDRAGPLFLGFLAYALVAPRFKDYSYILLIPPSVYVVVSVLQGLGTRLLALALLCTHLFAYQSWVTALFLFTACLARLHRPPRRPPAPAEAPGPA